MREAAYARASAYFLALNCLGSLIGPVITGVVMDCFGKSAMPASGIAAVLLVLVGWAILRERHAAPNAPQIQMTRSWRNAA